MLDEYKKLLKEFIAFQTVSSDSSKKDEIAKAADWLRSLLKTNGFSSEVVHGYGNPVVVGSYVINSKLPTALIYGHFDVMSAKRQDWESDPFKMMEKEGKVFGRGTMDDKGQILLHVMMLGRLIQEKKLQYNIKVLFEGEEEMGSPHIEKYIADHQKELSCDFVFLSDGEMILGKPTIELGNRGLLNFTLTIITAANELHSGIYGGAAPNAVHEMATFVQGLLDANNKITIDELYEIVEDPDLLANTPFDIDQYQKITGAKILLTEENKDFHIATGQRPAITVTSFVGGFLGEGHKTIIPQTATAKINIRIVKNQDPHAVEQLVKKYVAKVLPSYVSYQLIFDEYANPNKTDVKSKFVQQAEKVLEELFSEKVVHKYVGGTEPALSYLQTILNVPVVSVPFANEDGYMHGNNENFTIENIKKGMKFSEKFFGGK